MVSGNMPAFSAYRASASDLVLTNATFTKMVLDTESFDTNNCFDTSTYRFTPTVAGYYQINASVFTNWVTSQFSSFRIYIYKNGSAYKASQVLINAVTDVWYGNINVQDVVSLNGSTDYVEIYLFTNGGSSACYNGGITQTYASGSMVRGA
jgi:hypothetical protein